MFGDFGSSSSTGRLGTLWLVELPPEWVSAEREAAEKHEYRKSFRELFAKITGDKPIDGM